MKKIIVPFALVAIAALSACSSVREMRSATYAPVEPTVTSLRTGNGKVATALDPTGPVNGISTQYLTIRMDDGTVQTVERRGQQIAIGEHVTITSSNTIKRDPLAYRATQ